MRKTLILLPLFLLTVFIVLSLLDKSDYVLEKKFWLLSKQSAIMTQNPKSITENQFNNIIKRYEHLISQYPKSRLLPEIYINLAEIYSMKGDSTRAIGIYQQLMRVYPHTAEGLKAPILLIKYLFQLNEKQEASVVIKESEEFYEKIIAEDRGSSLGFSAMGFLARIYLVEERWQEAMDLFKSILLDHARSPLMNGEIAATVIRAINQLSIEKLHDPTKAILIYQSFMNKYPDHPWNKFLKETIISLREGASL